jgi:hypothetical protein
LADFWRGLRLPGGPDKFRVARGGRGHIIEVSDDHVRVKDDLSHRRGPDAAVYFMTPNINLVGATVTATLAIDNPASTPVQIQLFTGGDASTYYSWGGQAILTFPPILGL